MPKWSSFNQDLTIAERKARKLLAASNLPIEIWESEGVQVMMHICLFV